MELEEKKSVYICVLLGSSANNSSQRTADVYHVAPSAQDEVSEPVIHHRGLYLELFREYYHARSHTRFLGREDGATHACPDTAING